MTVKRTGGGRFDPTDRDIYFVVGEDGVRKNGMTIEHPYGLLAINDLGAGEAPPILEDLTGRGKAVMLDSGIYNLASTHARKTGITTMEAWATPPDEMPGFEALWERYGQIVRAYEDRLWGYVELDLGGVESKRRLRARLEAEGLRPIPVYHPLADGWDYFDELAEQYDRICWGNLAGTPQLVRKRMVATAFERHRKYPDLWIHLLGYTPNEWLVGMPADSADSSTWLRGVRWGGEAGSTYLRRFSKLPPGYRYTIGDGEQWSQSVALSGANAHFLHRNWRRIHADLAAELGTVLYPEITT